MSERMAALGPQVLPRAMQGRDGAGCGFPALVRKPDPRTGHGRWGPGQCPSQSWTAFAAYMLLSREAQQRGLRCRGKGILVTRPCEALGGAERADGVWPRSHGGQHDAQQCQAPRWFYGKSPLPCFCSAVTVQSRP